LNKKRREEQNRKIDVSVKETDNACWW